MRTLLTKFILLFALPICTLANFSLPASADSTADLILNLQCQGGYDINIWKTHSSGELLYRSTGDNGNLSLGRGTSRATEGVRVYRFQNNNYQYWVWDGTLDNSKSGTLEVYRNNHLLMQRSCVQR